VQAIYGNPSHNYGVSLAHSGLTNLILDRYWRLSKREINTLLAECVHSSVNKPPE